MDGAQFARQIAEAIQQLMMTSHGGTQPQASGSGSRAITAMREFRRMDPPEFRGKLDPMVAEDWMEQVKKILDTIRVHENELRVSFTSFQFTGDIAQWWKIIKSTHNVEVIEWGTFTKLFLDKYFPEVARDTKRDEFMFLIQSSMTVNQYEASFTRLSRFTPEVIAIEEYKCKRFEKGLRLGIRERIIPQELCNYSTLVLLVEESLRDTKRILESKSQSGGSNSQPGDRPKKRQREDNAHSQGQC
ncbi:uncharacterized protein LOC132309338 [Cornus florida]|uniref:uncharacterized protein LOC132309338 n=1 Tax=Cornus florida TaxID=4283 RepID=UPI00289A588B|nr:uncharacterized protein LOC132309338 [Cornus florida]